MKKIKIVMLFLFVLLLISFFIINFKNNKVLEMQENLISKIENNLDNSEMKDKIFNDGTIGMIIIPSIGVEAPIVEGTSTDILKYAVRSF